MLATLATKVKQLWTEMHAETIQTKSEITIVGDCVYKKNNQWENVSNELYMYRRLKLRSIPNIANFDSVTIKMEYAGTRINNVPDGYKLLGPIIKTLYLIIKNDLIYLDIKPENICFMNGKITLIDFELCNYVDQHYNFTDVYIYWPPEFVHHVACHALYNNYLDKVNELLLYYYKITIPFTKINGDQCCEIYNDNIKTNIWSIGVMLHILKAEGKYLEMAQKCIHWNPKLRPSYDDIISLYQN